jgi:hypothetical protein
MNYLLFRFQEMPDEGSFDDVWPLTRSARPKEVWHGPRAWIGCGLLFYRVFLIGTGERGTRSMAC